MAVDRSTTRFVNLWRDSTNYLRVECSFFSKFSISFLTSYFLAYVSFGIHSFEFRSLMYSLYSVPNFWAKALHHIKSYLTGRIFNATGSSLPIVKSFISTQLEHVISLLSNLVPNQATSRLSCLFERQPFFWHLWDLMISAIFLSIF